mgnify:CR=1 FL=1
MISFHTDKVFQYGTDIIEARADAFDELKEQYNSIMSVVHPNKSESTSKSLTSSIISSVAKNSISSSVNSAIKNAISTESSVDDITNAYKTVESFLKKFKG